MKNKIYGMIAGVLVTALTVFLYLILVDNIFKVPMALYCMGAVVISEIAALVCYSLIEKPTKQLLLTAVFGLHALVTAGASLVFINILPLAYTSFWVFYACSICAAVLISLFAAATTGSAKKSREELNNAKCSMVSTRAVVNNMINTAANAEYVGLLKELDEDLRFSDDSTVHGMDATIYSSICQLAQNISDSSCDVPAAVENIRKMISQRNFMVKNTKANR